MDTLCVVAAAVGMTGLYGIRTCLKYRQRRNHMVEAISPADGEEIQVGVIKLIKSLIMLYENYLAVNRSFMLTHGRWTYAEVE